MPSDTKLINLLFSEEGTKQILNNNIKIEEFNIENMENDENFKIDNKKTFQNLGNNENVYVMKILENIYRRVKNMDLPFDDYFNNLNIFKYLTYLLSKNCPQFQFSYAKYLFRLLKYCYISKELQKSKIYCEKLEVFREKLKNTEKFSLWKAKLYFRLGDYMEAIRVLKLFNTTNCKLKMFKYYLKSEFYSKTYVINHFYVFLSE